MLHFLLHITGGDNGSGPFYLELSGFAGLLFACGFIVKWYEGTRCHIGGAGFKGCKRRGHYPFKHYKLCHKHHPEHPQGVLTHLHVIKLHKQDNL